jgi:hypothetical protein
MSRFDKYDPISGGFRAPLAADFAYTASNPDYAHANLNKVICVALDSNGRVIIGTPLSGAAGNTVLGGLIGVICVDTPLAAGEIVDVMTSGEIVEFTLPNGAAAAAGTTYTSNVDGTYGATTVGATNGRIGTTVEATRLVVRVVQGAENTV